MSLKRTMIRTLPSAFRKKLIKVLVEDAVRGGESGEMFGLIEECGVMLEDALRKSGTPEGEVKGYAGSPVLRYDVMNGGKAAWNQRRVGAAVDIPNMLSEEEVAYYHWLGQYYGGVGEVVELGPWLGCSTVHLAVALRAGLERSGRKVHVFDDFVWRSDWMDQYLRPQDPPKPGGYEDFQPIFEHFVSEVRGLLEVTKAKIADYDGNERLPAVTWCGKPVELLVADCGRTVKANQSWYDVFSPSFIPDRTLVVMQDWRLHRERPRKAYNQTQLFTAMLPKLELVHETSDGGIGTFLYRGER